MRGYTQFSVAAAAGSFGVQSLDVRDATCCATDDAFSTLSAVGTNQSEHTLRTAARAGAACRGGHGGTVHHS
jgi:hypothetical protein